MRKKNLNKISERGKNKIKVQFVQLRREGQVDY